MNPYEVLGVSTDASPDTVRGAYRNRAKETHPDHEGSDVEFRAVQLAYDVLSDAERREYYDRTGNAEPRKALSPEAEFMATVQPFLQAVFAEIAKRGQSSNSVDIVDTLKRAITKAEADQKEKVTALEKVKRIASEAVKFFELRDANEPEPNLLAELAQSQLAIVEQDLQTLNRQRQAFIKAIEILGKYKYRVRDGLYVPTRGVQFNWSIWGGMQP